MSVPIWSVVPVMGNLCCSEEEVEEEEESSTFGYVNTNTRIFEGSLSAFLAPSLKPFIACSSCFNGPNPATGIQPSA